MALETVHFSLKVHWSSKAMQVFRDCHAVVALADLLGLPCDFSRVFKDPGVLKCFERAFDLEILEQRAK